MIDHVVDQERAMIELKLADPAMVRSNVVDPYLFSIGVSQICDRSDL